MSIVTMIGRSRFGGRARPEDETEPPPEAAVMVGQWKLDGNGTDALGLSNGTLLGTPETGLDDLGPAGTSIGFDGIDDRMTIPHVAGMLLSSYSIVFWFQADVLPDSGTHTSLINKENAGAGGLSVEYQNNGGVGSIRAYTRTAAGSAAFIGSSSGNGTANIATGYRVTLCVDGNGARLYLGNTELASSTNAQGLQSNTAAWSIGSWQGGTTSAFNGVIDEVRLYDGALTPTEIAALPTAVSITHVEEPPPTGELVINPPIAPQSYSIPGGATNVSNATQLQTQLGSTSAKNIVLANGTYDKSSVFTMGAGHKLWAQNLGGATVTAGFDVTQPNAEFHGIRFDVALRSKTVDARRDGAIIYTRNNGHFCKVQDCWFEGHMVVGAGVDFSAVNGSVAQRLVINHFSTFGVRGDGSPDTASPRMLFTDLDIMNIDRDPNHISGQGEFGVKAGTSGLYERIRTRNTYWSGIVPATHNENSEYRHIDINGTRSAGFYFEHHCYGTQLLEYFRIGGPSGGTVNDNGVNTEAAQDRWGCEVTVHDGATIRHGEITTPKIGMNIATGNIGVTVDDVKFIGQCNGGCAINDQGSLAWSCGGTNHPAVPGGNVFTNLDVSEMDPGAVTLKQLHWSQISCV